MSNDELRISGWGFRATAAKEAKEAKGWKTGFRFRVSNARTSAICHLRSAIGGATSRREETLITQPQTQNPKLETLPPRRRQQSARLAVASRLISSSQACGMESTRAAAFSLAHANNAARTANIAALGIPKARRCVTPTAWSRKMSGRSTTFSRLPGLSSDSGRKHNEHAA